MRGIPSPLAPMEALSVAEIPEGPAWAYEPKWDGFRCVAFRDKASVVLQSKSGKPLDRYFPEIVAAIKDLEPRSFVLDGELVVPVKDAFSFDDLLQRIHPAQSHVKKLATEKPAILIVFDMLAEGSKSLLDQPFGQRRAGLEQFAKRAFGKEGTFRLSPETRSAAAAKKWLRRTNEALRAPEKIVGQNIVDGVRCGRGGRRRRSARALRYIRLARPQSQCVLRRGRPGEPGCRRGARRTIWRTMPTSPRDPRSAKPVSRRARPRSASAVGGDDRFHQL
jgi:hypothetical protein